MSFLQIAALWAIPVVLTPIIIHWIHRRRHPAVAWAATMFLRRAQASRRGPTRLRRLLIMTCRVLALAALVFATARPLSSGAFGFAAGRVGGRQAVSIILLDRSPSMMRRQSDSGQTRLQLVKQQVAAALKTLHVERIVLIESVSGKPKELSDPDRLVESPMTSPAGSTASIPEMFRDALLYLDETNQSVADIWICSDGQWDDWDPTKPQWDSVRRLLADFGAGIRVHRFAFTQTAQAGSHVRVTDVRAVDDQQGAAIELSVQIESDDPAILSTPLSVTIGQATSVVAVPMRDGRGVMERQRFPVTSLDASRFGRVSIPADANAADNQWFFRVVSDDDSPSLFVFQDRSEGVEVALDVLGDVTVWEQGDLPDSVSRFAQVSCIVWQGRLPTGDLATQLTQAAQRGVSVVFFPPNDEGVSDSQFAGVRWGEKQAVKDRTATFAEIDFRVDSFHRVVGPTMALAEVAGIGPVIASTRIGEGTVYFCGMNVNGASNRFVNSGIVLFGLLASAIDEGNRHRFGGGSFFAGDDLTDRMQELASTVQPVLVTEKSEFASFEFGHHPGVYRLGEGDEESQLIAINRSVSESTPRVVRLEELSLPEVAGAWSTVTVGDGVESSSLSLVQEIWASIWLVVIVCLIGEAVLSLPRRARGVTA